ncbi:putative membrane protein [Enterococcus sp. PF1-24]|uniref:DUF975 family protein n=1 Tax=unclassified Enterococcus TaxID=2608891 RepID=UPI0024752426|nr:MULTISPECIES: DUF975 family protein [unclassified Enterococcus]MDH6365300.1 putative membrane protein [Enterococcus sp. PFB1-1]MDH6402370.1 putative membrane protein [Enterococcus sp. PF1-24]
MLRKEIKESAQRLLKGKYDQWVPLVIIPCLLGILSFFIIIKPLSGQNVTTSTSNQTVTRLTKEQEDEAYEDGYDDGYDVGYEDGYQEAEDDYYYDYDYDYDYYDYYTPAYNYGYALGGQAGYLEGWQDGLKNVGDGEYQKSKKEIIADLEDRPEEFLNSDEFVTGVIDAYDYSYYEAWDDAQIYKKEAAPVNYMPKLSEKNQQVQLLSVNSQQSASARFVNRNEVNRKTTNDGLVTLASFLLLMIVLIYQMIYHPLLVWAGIAVIDGENLKIKEVWQALRSRLKQVALANFQINLYTFLWSLLFVFPGIWKQAGYSMTNYLMNREADLDSNQAIALSKQLMKGHHVEYIAFQCSFFFWQLATVYSCGLASFYTTPYYTASEALFFDEIYYEKRSSVTELPKKVLA